MTPDDLADLHARGFTRDRPWSADEIVALLDTPHTHLVTRPHGFALWRAVAGEAELLTIVVDPEHRQQGIGDALMADWMVVAAALAETAFLEVAADNVAACALYHRHGFATVATRTGYYAQHTPAVDALVMRADLPASLASR